MITYATKAKKINLDIKIFSKLCAKVKGKDKDNLNEKYFKKLKID